ncbi:metallophosphoesterase [Rhodovulum euryhalinum]|uniref:Calcineurin-like phosphoesterase family protein n=1 Tax=Rhodovulum euryhalinum TaxID=35805 RepID=A0A4V2SA24_9RHOB|nr:metallophosphoesterase [Rhodovulum euryhalinum]TCO70060.1 calcineurin-like phosphoesterase family protein [Rhodovulum euryhalinum]
MTRDLGDVFLGKASAFGVPAIGGIDTDVLALPAFGVDRALTLKVGAATDWAIGFDLYVPQPAGSYVSLLQTGTGDGELFLRDNGDGTAGLGISSVYEGAVPFDTWVRLVATFTVEGGETILRKFVNGALVGEQNLGATDRWAVPEVGLRLFTDNDGETAPVFVSSIFFTDEVPSAPEVAAILGAYASPDAAGFFPVQPSEGAVQVDFANEDVVPTYGTAEVILDGAGFRTPVVFGDSTVALASQIGIEGPGGADIPVLAFPAYARDEGLRLDLPAGLGTVTSYTMVWDVRVGAMESGWFAFLQTDVTQSGDGEFFARASDRAIGIGGDYDGALPQDAWARVAITVADQGDGTALLSKYIDGTLIDTQSVNSDRFALNSDTGFLILTENDGETAKGYLSHFGVSAAVLDAGAVAALGSADAAGPFADDGLSAQIGFTGYVPTVEFGFAGVSLTDTLPAEEAGIANPIKDMLVAEGAAAMTFDLAQVFGAGATAFAVTTSHGEVAAARIDGTTLSVDFGALGFSDLVISATAADGTALADNVRVRVAGEGAYTIAILPDTQDYTSNGSITPTFAHMTQWLADNADGKNIGFVTHVGDITQTATTGQFDIALAAMDVLRDAGIPFSVLPGNHDIGTGGSSDVRETDEYNAAFSTVYMSGDPTFGGVYDQEPGRYDNNYHLWTAPDGTGWIILNLEFGPRDDVMRWADDVLTQHGDRKAMVLTHSMMNWDGRHDALGAPLQDEGAGYDYGLGNDPRGAWDAETLWREVLSRHPNVVFTAGGHIFGDGAQTQVSYNDFGNAVYQFLVNYQNGVANETNGAGDPAAGGNGGNGAIRLVTVDPANNAFYTETYFTEFDEYFSGSRGSDELIRDGLQGPYAGHEETYTGVDLGAREAEAIADAGDDIVTADPVTLDAARTSNPRGEELTYTWTDAAGTVIATGATATVAPPPGVNDLVLTVTAPDGVTSRDDLRVIVTDANTHLAETFDDGDAAGWVPPAAALEGVTSVGTDLGFALPSAAGLTQGTYTLAFDSHWRPEDSQTAQVLVSIDGAAPAELLRLDSDTTTDDGSNQNEHVELSFLVPDAAASVEVFFRMSEAGNDWFWAIDNVTLTGPDGSLLIDEDFEGLTLTPAVNESIAVPGWTHDAPAGWTVDTPASVPQGADEWRGWSFTTPEFWTSADGQDRANFTLGTGIIAVADPDEWDDFNGGSETGADYETTLAAPRIDLDGAGVTGTGVLRVPALADTRGLKVTPTVSGPVTDYTLVFDLYVEDGQGTWAALFQTDTGNTSDAELFLRNAGDGTGAIGTMGDYDGAVTYGGWTRLAFTFSVEGGAQVLRKYVDGTLVGTQTVDADISDGSRWTIDGDRGFLLFSDEDGETAEVHAAAFAFAGRALDAAEIAALGGVDGDGPFDAAPDAAAVQFGFDGTLAGTDFGTAGLEEVTFGTETGTPFFVKGSALSRPGSDGLAAPQGALFDQSNGADNLLLWQDGAWGDLVMDVTLKSLDNDTMGVVFRYADAQNHYLLTLDSQTNLRQLIKVQGGVQTVLASETGGYRFYDEVDLRLRAEGGEIAVGLDGVLLFGGAVTDAAPLGAGTVGLYSSGQDGTIFDDIVVRVPAAEAVVGPRIMVVDFDGDGREIVTLDAALSVGATGWNGGDETRVEIEAVAGRTRHTLTAGEDTAVQVVDVMTGDRLIAADRFEDGDAAGWRIVDTTETGGPADWQVIDGALTELSGAASRELTWAGASNPDVWATGWSPHGDGVFALHKGTYALWEGDTALTDYAIEAQIAVPGAGGVGFMLNWQDAETYYKFEIDARVGLTTLVKVVEGYESHIGRVLTTYTPGDSFHLRAETVDGFMQVWLDGQELFAYAIEDRDLDGGAAGLYAWGAAGARFDDVAIVDLTGPLLNEVTGTAGGDLLSGTAADDLILSMGGTYDRLAGGAGADVFWFADELANGRRERDLITDFEVGVDSILLGSDAVTVRETASSLILQVGPDGDLIYVIGAGLTEQDLGLVFGTPDMLA